jgi:DNA-binding transcriptional MerR regulator
MTSQTGTYNKTANNDAGTAKSSVDKSRKSKSAFRTISEVADELDVQQHVLRFWETKFSQVRPLKRGGGRRYYRPEDVELLKRIHELLYTEGYTIKGVQKLFRQNGKNSVLEGEVGGASAVIETPAKPLEKQQTGLNAEQKSVLKDMLSELKDLRAMVGGAR